MISMTINPTTLLKLFFKRELVTLVATEPPRECPIRTIFLFGNL